ncbi:phage terminase large subunit family protein [Stutzerimonas nosocomialis]|uniref:Phage terminase large subunit family protein n=2 Tax=Stutzerimonas nosocomialis TaxID=1056496 RepID=A0A5R9QIJ7_9GAMM|nr:phage terminase large subunit family protein [Stutzerimonas nosocomialis]
MRTSLAVALLDAAQHFNPPKSTPTDEWISSEFYLPPEAGLLSGLYDFYYTPYFLGVAAALDDPDTSEVDLMKAAQIGWTYFLIGYVFKQVVGRPMPIMVLFAKEGDGKNFNDEKLIPAARANPMVARLMDVNTAKKAGNRWNHKSFPGGFLKLVASNSPGNVKSTSSVGLAVVEEPDDTSDDVKGQGDAIGLLEERIKRYPGSKMLVGGTPSLKGLSKTEQRLKQTDQRVLPIVCHECGQAHVLDFEHIHYLHADEDTQPHEVYGRALPDTAWYACPHCGGIWDDYQRKENVRNTVFEAVERGDPLRGWVRTAPFYGKAGFLELNELYACLPGTTLAGIVREKLAAEKLADQGDVKQLIKFVNQKQGRAYEYRSDLPDADRLAERAEEYRELVVPAGGLILTMTVDVQHDRLAVILRAWGRGEESWLVLWTELAAQNGTSDKSDPVWQELDRLLFGTYEHAKGYRLRITAASIDASDGQTNDAVYHFVRTRRKRLAKLLAIKGSTNLDAEILTAPRKIDLNTKSTKAAKYGLQVYMVGTNKAKDLLAERLKLTGHGPGRMHTYKGVRADYHVQLCGEVKAPSRKHSGKKVWQQKAGAAIEAWDCEAYQIHLARYLRLHLKAPSDWDGIEAGLMQADLLAEADAVPPVQPLDDYEAPQSATAEPPRSVSLADLGRLLNGDD